MRTLRTLCAHGVGRGLAQRAVMQEQASVFRPDIQALRAIAVTAVVVFHLWPATLGGGYVVYKGSGASVAITGLNADAVYYVRVYNFNGGGTTENYRTSDELAGSRTTLLNEPGASPTGLSFTSVGTNGMTINWAGVSTQVLVVVRAPVPYLRTQIWRVLRLTPSSVARALIDTPGEFS